MDKQKLITIAKDQLKGGIGEDQVRELLTYRGVEANDVAEIMQEVLRAETQPVTAEAEDVVQKADMVIAELIPDAPTQPEYIKKERNILLLSIAALFILLITGSVVYYFYF
ncbi:MAG: hypothetical protein UY31_C0012G0005 [Candidatus Wolfebacteria bacterium GW2011_GWE1_48_7]|uniref:Uncharacterized protein n=2 Tax=Candidatus Wolfeibacteriota TaxID=1752735 RepID=A0A0G1WJ03_9BACT|nr:MAG: hypothetical protein UX70_C0001G0532 [Candidatus Wolfebacteria bacterium GW2011_GWB1_47_1]KKU34516.1 MAG: hypothetical protein UX49_C0043G0005 [Candidatus Wolfebacteria bacterium GW2011_GWC2_46_275]KKU42530.1 MAG: hypothetical protein UX58_C0002G0244 [Candidatus Wolfebacteria bacterium GW2011_GWB2_46_69]KKU53907.1 MAG: hypothetical protein UX76_C0008G0030 [Candidatus Wolfebacteria bacterium GW2011_GWC1_47_103]KKU59683.1 MAG: hypothetical protein UX83_C0003G0098 [Candidatus Wolfebacteria